MKRIDIHYGGQTYSVGGRDFAEFRAEVEEGMRAGTHWIVVNDGEGARRDAHLLLTPGTPIVLIPIPDEAPVLTALR
jgi:hypothetical protein